MEITRSSQDANNLRERFDSKYKGNNNYELNSLKELNNTACVRTRIKIIPREKCYASQTYLIRITIIEKQPLKLNANFICKYVPLF